MAGSELTGSARDRQWVGWQLLVAGPVAVARGRQFLGGLTGSC